MQLKKIIPIFFMLLYGMTVVPAGAAVFVPDSVKTEMNQAMDQTVMVYDVDAEKSQRQLEQMDRWFENQVDVKQSVSRANKKGTRLSLRRTFEKNQAIAADANVKQEKTVDPGKAFDVFYIKKPMQRSFKKAIVKPVAVGLEESEVIELGKKFIQNQKLCPLGENDQLGTAVVVDRKKQALDEKQQKREEYVVSQKVRFTRQYQGLEVINARQSVEIHPESREILGYKSKDWAVIKEKSGKAHARPVLAEVMQTIENQFKKSSRTYQASKVKTALYQTETQLIPVMLVSFDVQEAKNDEAAIPEEEILIVSLAKDVAVTGKEKTKRAPKEK